MIGLLITSHGKFCVGALDSLEMIAGRNNLIEYVSLENDGIGKFSEKIKDKLDEMLKVYDHVLIFTDIPGGTPYNICFQYILESNPKIRLISGMNLPMLIETSVSLSFIKDIDELVAIAVNSGKDSIKELEINENNDNDIDL